MMHWGYSDGWGYWGIGLGWLMMATFWVAVIAFTVWIVATLLRAPHRTESRALEILKERYARGEIDKAEFEEKKKDLQ